MRRNETSHDTYLRIIETRLSLAPWMPEPFSDWYGYARDWCETEWEQYSNRRDDTPTTVAQEVLERCRRHVLSRANDAQ